ncbi:MAG: PEGA domain-containing protein [Lentisphaeria bacterium]|nr:PEGA domain-containing protein [Lentisphaeria bacterium]
MFVRFLGLLILTSALFAEGQSKAVLLVRDLSGKNLSLKVPKLEAILGTQLTAVGLDLIDHKLIYDKFEKQGIDPKKIEDSSANGIAKSLGAEFVVLADIIDLSKKSKKFTGYGITSDILFHTLTVNVKISRCDTGETVLASTMKSTEKSSNSKNLKVIDEGILVNLLTSVSTKLAASFKDSNALLNKIGKEVKANRVMVRINSTVMGVVSINGLVVGVTNSPLEVPAGINLLKIERTNFGTFEKNVNFIDKQVLNIDLELTEKGFQLYKRDKLFALKLKGLNQNMDLNKAERLTAIEIAKLRAKGEIKAMVNVSEGRMDMLKNSKYNLDTQNVKDLRIGDDSVRDLDRPINIINNSSEGDK